MTPRRDKLFMFIISLLAAIIVLYGCGMMIYLLIEDPGDTVALRFVTSIGSLFAGLLGLCTGYLIGASRNGHKNGNGDT